MEIPVDVSELALFPSLHNDSNLVTINNKDNEGLLETIHLFFMMAFCLHQGL